MSEPETTISITFNLTMPGEPGSDDIAAIERWAYSAYEETMSLDFVAEVTYDDPVMAPSTPHKAEDHG